MRDVLADLEGLSLENGGDLATGQWGRPPFA